MKTHILLLSLVALPLKAELLLLDQDELGDIAGTGVGVVLRDISLNGGEKASGSGQIQTRFSDYSSLNISELNIKKSGTNYTQAFNVGSTSDPISIDVNEVDRITGPRDEMVFSLPNTIDPLDIHLRLDYQAIDGFFELAATPEQFFAELDLKNLKVSDTTASIWGDDEYGLALSFETSLSLETLEISGTADQAANASLSGVTIRNLTLGNPYQPLTITTTEEPTRQYDIAKGVEIPDSTDLRDTLVDKYNSAIESVENQIFEIAQVTYIPTEGALQETAIVPRFEYMIAPLTEETAAAKYAPYENDPDGYRETLTDIEIESISFGNGVTLTPLPSETVFLTPAQGPDVSWTYGENVVEVQGLDIQYMRFTPRDIIQ